ncbi:Epoxide hydrolase hydrolase [Mycena chlorophos]|uniref:Epoxide hydrolase hydrolase n=1 Tax=Mycena chlorophos TaxID=658473 RepID=A0A8H6TKV0_MYCCL|nr:Epoxide hydrolase hydrolase [Mycena chlorophos]
MSNPATWPNLPKRVKSRFISVNGLRMHILEAHLDDGNTKAPLVLLLHGFPELAYSWRKVIGPLADAAFHVVAPDLRAVGRTTSTGNPEGHNVEYSDSLEPFRMTNMVKDIVALCYALGYDSVAAVVGHDFGSAVAAYCALIRPDLFKSVVLMSAPFPGAPQIKSEPLLPTVGGVDATWQKVTDGLREKNPPKKHYMVYYSTPEAAQDMDQPPSGLQAFFRGYYHVKSADWKGNSEPPPHALPTNDVVDAMAASLPHYYVMPLEATMPTAVDSLGPSLGETEWLTDAELAVYVEEYGRTGFQGGLNWYRNRTGTGRQDDVALFFGKHIEVPAMFLSGALDWGIYQAPGATEAMRRKVCPKMGEDDFVLIEGASHWVQQEKGAEVAQELLRFLKKVL